MYRPYLPFKKKSLQAISNPSFLTVLEGAVRSAKTITANYGFIMDVIASPEQRHLITGVTQAAAFANCVSGEFGIIALSGNRAEVRRDEKNEVFIYLMGKRIDVFGGDKISSFELFRGRSYGSTLNDECNLQHKNTIQESFNRTIASRARHHWMTLNPESPSHWIYKDIIDKYEEEATEGYRYFHFTLDDNPAITEERKEELKKQFTGLFYRRFILGQRVRAEGACYPSWSESCVLDVPPEPKTPGQVSMAIIGSDIGGTGSATAFSAVGFFMNKNRKLSIIVLDELYDKENKSTEAVLGNFQSFTTRIKTDYNCIEARTDSAEQLIKRSMQNIPGIGLTVKNSIKRPIVDRIRLVDWLMSAGRFFVMRHCTHTIEAIQGAVWKEGAAKETRLDDGSSNIDSLDAMEYAIEPRMRDFR